MEASAAGGQNLAARRHETFVTSDSCPAGQSCIHGPAAEHDGADAAYVVYRATGATGAGSGPYDCFVYVYREGAGWHPYDGYCTQQISASIGGTEYIYTPGTCANIRNPAGLQAPVVDCLPHHQQVTIDQAPQWLDGHLWWHLASHGWTVHENLYPDFNSGSLTCGGGPPECWINGN